MEEYRRQGKHTVRVGDAVRVAPGVLTATGVAKKDRGFRARVVRFVQSATYGVAAEVVRLDGARRGTVRVVAAERLTRMRPSKAVIA